jgi:hypothetical protein
MQDEKKILPNGIPRRIIGGRMQIYEHFRFNKRKSERQHNKNYDSEIITSLPKKWITDNKRKKSDTCTHYDLIVKSISRIGLISPHKLLWPPVLYLIHQEKNHLRDLQQRFQRHGKLSPKQNIYLHDWNELLTKAKLDDLRVNYFAK